jgi:hypothetical protein
LRSSSTNEFGAAAPQQIHKAGTAMISPMHWCQNHVNVC